MTREGFNGIANFMAPVAGVLVIGCSNMQYGENIFFL